MKKIILCILFYILSTHLYAHKIAGMDLKVQKIEENKILVEGLNKKTNEKLDGNKIKFLSLNNKVLFEGHLNKGSLVTDIPNVSYFIYMYVGDQDVVIEGISPKEGFTGILSSKKDKAFFYTLSFSLFMIILGTSIFIRRKLNNY